MSEKPGPRFGVHVSIAGRLSNAVTAAEAKGCDCFQIFARNPRGWLERPLKREEVLEFRTARDRGGLWPVAIHSVYLINLAAQDPEMLAKSRAAFRSELERALHLRADYLVVHPGNPRTASADAGIATAIESIRVASKGLRLGNKLTILIENTAGQGSSIGCSFDQIADIIAGLSDLPVGVCFDTAHALASGHDLSTAAGFTATVRAINRSFGFARLRLVHCNDSKVPLGSRVDRHQHIGLGHIGEDGFRRLTHNLKFRRIPFILETPEDQERDDSWNLNKIRYLASR